MFRGMAGVGVGATYEVAAPLNAACVAEGAAGARGTLSAGGADPRLRSTLDIQLEIL